MEAKKYHENGSPKNDRWGVSVDGSMGFVGSNQQRRISVAAGQ